MRECFEWLVHASLGTGSGGGEEALKERKEDIFMSYSDSIQPYALLVLHVYRCPR